MAHDNISRRKFLGRSIYAGTALSLAVSGQVAGKQTPTNSAAKKESWKFVSMPDFLNVDCDYPQAGWEDSLCYILKSVKNENPDFLVVPGDLVMGHWDRVGKKDDIVTIEKFANRYYSAWINRMKAHDLKFYASLGDHEVGDNGWRDRRKLKAVKDYKRVFAEHLKMPRNGPDHMKGTAFWWKHKNVLFIAVDVFEEGQSNQGLIRVGVTSDQLAWFKQVLEENQDVDHRIVLGHTPILGPVRSWSSSRLMVQEGRESQFWQTMKSHNVDMYLCGECHAITCKERDGIMQVVHGGLIGYNTRTNYMVVTVSKNKIDLEIKEIEMLPSGETFQQMQTQKRWSPLKNVTISQADRAKGFYTVGLARIEKRTGKQFINRKGYFEIQHESSNERAVAIFDKRVNQKNKLSKIVVK